MNRSLEGMRLWRCEHCGHENDEDLVTCKNCGTLRGNSDFAYDNQDSEDLFLDDEYL